MKEDSRRRCRNAAILHKNLAGALLAVKLMLKNSFLNVTWLQEEAEVNNGSQQQTIEDIRNDCQLVLANKNLDQDKLPALPLQFFPK